MSDYLNQLKSLASKVSGKTDTTKLTATALSGISFSSLSKQLGSTAGLFGKGDPANINLGSVSGITKTLSDQTAKRFAGLGNMLNSGDSSGAVAAPTTFVTAPAQVAVDTIKLPEVDNHTPVSDHSAVELAKIATQAQMPSITSDTELSEAYSRIATQQQAIQTAAAGNAALLMSDQDYSGGAFPQFQSVFDPTIEESDAPLAKLPDSVSLLPASLQDQLKTDDLDLASQYEERSEAVGSQSYGMDGLGDSLLSVLGLGQKHNSYPQVTDQNGNAIPGISRDVSYNTASQTYRAAQALCPNVDASHISNYGAGKDTFDSLLAYILGLGGLADLLNKLLNCTSSAQYLDGRSRALMVNATPGLAQKGDVQSLSTMSSYLGASSFTDPYQTTRLTAANMEKTPENLAAFDTMTTELGVEPQSLYYEEPGVLSAENTIFMSAHGTEITDRYLEPDTRDTVFSIYSAYA